MLLCTEADPLQNITSDRLPRLRSGCASCDDRSAFVLEVRGGVAGLGMLDRKVARVRSPRLDNWATNAGLRRTSEVPMALAWPATPTAIFGNNPERTRHGWAELYVGGPTGCTRGDDDRSWREMTLGWYLE